MFSFRPLERLYEHCHENVIYGNTDSEEESFDVDDYLDEECDLLANDSDDD